MAGGDQGLRAAVGLRPSGAAPGGHDLRAGAAPSPRCGDTERRLAGDVLAAIVSGELDGSELHRRLEPFGLARASARWSPTRQTRAAARPVAVETALADALRSEATPGLVASRGTARLRAGAGARRTPSCSRSPSAWPGGSRPSSDGASPLGVGRAVPGEQARRTYQEARCTLEAVSFAQAASGDRRGNGNGNGNGPPLVPARQPARAAPASPRGDLP